MAFVFPEDKATFTAPNGITYAWKDDHWVVQKFKGDHEVYVSPAPPSNPSEGKLWYDSSDDVIELFIYVDGAWVSATPNADDALESRIAANEEGIRDLWSDQTRQDFEIASVESRVDALEGVVGYYRYIIQTANATPRDGQLAFLKGDMSTTTRWGDATNIAVNPNALGGEVWPTDEVVTGDVLRFCLKGDITMEVSGFEAKVVQNNNNLFSIDTVVKEVGTIMDDSEYEVTHLSSFDPSGLATQDYVDAQDSNLKDYTDNQISGLQDEIDNKVNLSGENEITTPWRIKSYNKSFISVTGAEMKLYHIADPTNQDDAWAANKGYVDKKADDKLPLAGGTLTGPVDITGDARIKAKDDAGNVTFTLFPSGLIDSKNEIRIDRSGTEQCFAVKKDGTPRFSIQADGYANFFDNGGVKWKVDGATLSAIYKATSSITQWTAYGGNTIRITAKDSSDSGRTFVDIKTEDHNGDDGADDGYRMKLYHVADPVNPCDAANKRFVEEAAGVLNPPPARFKWKFKGTLDSNNPIDLRPGEFIGPSLASWNVSELKWYFHKQPLNCTKPIWQDYQYENFMEWQTAGPLLTMWEDRDGDYLPKIFAKNEAVGN